MNSVEFEMKAKNSASPVIKFESAREVAMNRVRGGKDAERRTESEFEQKKADTEEKQRRTKGRHSRRLFPVGQPIVGLQPLTES